MNTNTEMVDASATSQPAQYAGSLMQVATSGHKCQMSSFDPSSTEGAIMLVKATLMDATPLRDMIGKTIAVTDFYVHDAGREGKDGELDEWSRIVIFDDKGNAYSCGSRGVAKSLGVMCFARRQTQFRPPIRCEVKLKTFPNGHNWLTLTPNLDDLPAVKSEKGRAK